ncbi:hypothetical protein GLAREA_10349 [Glarea lozoyensis ATCC 20868]|uniref:Ubiquitin interaction domain-containing protein n=1 Tax=Glarea lozoyensis (strain ATCC 20868 / MF5171) TaxID=1116229 RepID=S3DA95_GLAL2|nr:uncharacterized protein GLAREA_10349 [Glarea lozoyensis ATCC 20868]EPE34655.1 hypothetical protein GLAREA_10349 [Glarea lozoyensis ATCC 20868]
MAGFAQPTQEDIDNFSSLAPGLPRGEIIARLKNNNNSVEQAAGEYFDDLDNPAGNKYKWEEGPFSSDRDGVPGNNNVSFAIHSPDVETQGGGGNGPYNNRNFDGAPSRPPSRISNNKSPHNVIDFSREAAAADPSTSKTYSGADDDMQQAINNSLLPPHLQPKWNGQESGVTNTNEVHFGPANRDEYKEKDWGVVALGKSSVQEILVDPAPAERKRDLMVTPAFLKPSIEDHRLGALLTIYHEIPKIREVFLDRGNVLPNYGFDKEWWTGKPVELPIIFEDEETSNMEVKWELQRLMAFLSKTDRSYGSVDALANLNEVKKGRVWRQDAEPAVLAAWSNAPTNNPATVNKLFSKGVSCEADEEHTKDFAILELELPVPNSIQDSVYDLADEALWPSLCPLDFDQSPYLSHIADVIAFKIEGDESKRAIDVPPIWYPDRYLKSSRQASLDMRMKKDGVQQDLDRIAILENRLTTFQMRNGKFIKVKDLFAASLQHDEARIEEDNRNGDDAMGDTLSARSSSKAQNLSAELRKLAANIDKKLIALNQERERAREALKNLSKLYTQPSEDPETPKLHPYTLRGVSTTKNTFYVCRVAEPDLINMDLDASEQSNAGQWWRIHYATSGPNQVSVEKTTLEKVLEAAKTESKNITLVYASEKAMEFKLETQALPGPLETFVRADNRAFKQELLESDFDDGSTQASLSSPGKRKFDQQRETDSSQDTSYEERWGGPNPSDEESNTSMFERDMGENGALSFDGAGPASQTLTSMGNGTQGSVNRRDDGIILGVDPSMIQKNPESGAQEMEELGGMRLGMMGPSNGVKSNTIDSMDLDEVLEDQRVAEPSGAVKKVGFAE